MKIAVWHNLPSGGGKRQLFEHIKGLVGRGHQIEAWCPPSADQAHLPLARLVPEHIVACQPIPWVPPPEARRRRRITAYYRYTRAKLAAMEQHCAACAREINAENFDLLFANSCMYVRVSSIGREVQLPGALYLGEPNRALYEASPRLPWVAPAPLDPKTSTHEWVGWLTDAATTQGNRVLVREELRNAGAYTEILVNSAYTRESVLRAYGKEARVCYLGVDAGRFKPLGIARENLVVGMGALHPDKQVELAIRAIATLPAAHRPPLHWVANFAIDGYRAQNERLAHDLGVTFVPHIGITDDEVVTLLNRATLMLYTPRLEPFGLAPLEANACETPVVTIAEGGIRETILDGVNGRVVLQDDPQLLGQAVGELLAQPERARELGRAGRERVLSRWTWTQATDRLEGYLQETLRAPQYQPG